MAMVIVNGLECEAIYIIKAGGTLNGGLLGPRSSYNNITTSACPEAQRGEADENDAGIAILKQKTLTAYNDFCCHESFIILLIPVVNMIVLWVSAKILNQACAGLW